MDADTRRGPVGGAWRDEFARDEFSHSQRIGAGRRRQANVLFLVAPVAGQKGSQARHVVWRTEKPGKESEDRRRVASQLVLQHTVQPRPLRSRSQVCEKTDSDDGAQASQVFQIALESARRGEGFHFPEQLVEFGVRQLARSGQHHLSERRGASWSGGGGKEGPLRRGTLGSGGTQSPSSPETADECENEGNECGDGTFDGFHGQ